MADESQGLQPPSGANNPDKTPRDPSRTSEQNPDEYYTNHSDKERAAMHYDKDGHLEINNVVRPDGAYGGGGHDNNALLALLMADRSRSTDGHYNNDTFGLGGGGLIGLAIALGLINRDGFGGHGRGKDCDPSPVDIVALQGINAIQAAIPTTALQTQGAFTQALASLALGTQQGFANTKDSVQNLGAVITAQLNNINQNVSDQGCQTREAVLIGVNTLSSKIDANIISELQATIAKLHSHGHSRDEGIRITNELTAVQVQAQQQQQQQAVFDEFRRRFSALELELQVARATNANLIIGSTGVATGQQNANPVNVR